MMKSHQDMRRWTGALLLAAVAISVVAPSALAASEKLQPVCPPAEQKLTATLDAEMQARLARKGPLPGVVEARLAETIERWRETESLELEILWQQAEAHELATLWHEADAVELKLSVADVSAIGDIRDVARIEGLRAAAALDRGIDALELRHWRQEWSSFAEEEDSTKTHAIRVGIDALVGLAKAPARAALTARHLIEAFAKVTPRVVRVLF